MSQDALNVTLALDQVVADAWQPFAPHFNVIQLDKPDKISNNIAMPKPVIQTLSRYISL